MTFRPGLERVPAPRRRAAPYTRAVNRLARIVLTWLLALALPVQGVVAATMQRCAPDHHANAASGHAHAHGDVHADAHGTDESAPAADGTCSVCAACCASAAIAASPLTLGLARTTPSYGPTREASPAQRAPDRLERPPRTHLA